jgi:hypothetical protein
VVVVARSVVGVVTAVVVELPSSGTGAVVGVDETTDLMVGAAVTETGSVDGSPTTSGCGSELELHAAPSNRAQTTAREAWRVRTGKTVPTSRSYKVHP